MVNAVLTGKGLQSGSVHIRNPRLPYMHHVRLQLKSGSQQRCERVTPVHALAEITSVAQQSATKGSWRNWVCVAWGFGATGAAQIPKVKQS